MILSKMSSNFLFEVNENVLCFYGTSLINAKCIKRIVLNRQNLYLIHFYGSTKSNDRLVNESQLLKLNENNMKSQLSKNDDLFRCEVKGCNANLFTYSEVKKHLTLEDYYKLQSIQCALFSDPKLHNNLSADCGPKRNESRKQLSLSHSTIKPFTCKLCSYGLSLHMKCKTHTENCVAIDMNTNDANQVNSITSTTSGYPMLTALLQQNSTHTDHILHDNEYLKIFILILILMQIIITLTYID